MRSQAEIVEHYRTEQGHDFLGFIAEALLVYVTADQAREFYKPGTDLSDWETEPLTEDHLLKEMRDYMEFAWGKVEGHRGISAERSVEKMQQWLWLLDRDDLLAQVEAAPYSQYGAPKLKLICEALGFALPTSQGAHNMMQGIPCRPGCREGCSH